MAAPVPTRRSAPARDGVATAILGAAGVGLIVGTFLPWLTTSRSASGWWLAARHGPGFDLSEELDSSGPAFTGFWTAVAGEVIVIAAIAILRRPATIGDSALSGAVAAAVATASLVTLWMFLTVFNYYTPVESGLAVCVIAAWVALTVWSYLRGMTIRTALAALTLIWLIFHWWTMSEDQDQVLGSVIGSLWIACWIVAAYRGFRRIVRGRDPEVDATRFTSG